MVERLSQSLLSRQAQSILPKAPQYLVAWEREKQAGNVERLSQSLLSRQAQSKLLQSVVEFLALEES